MEATRMTTMYLKQIVGFSKFASTIYPVYVKRELFYCCCVFRKISHIRRRSNKLTLAHFVGWHRWEHSVVVGAPGVAVHLVVVFAVKAYNKIPPTVVVDMPRGGGGICVGEKY